jgi:DNA-nicking Smr family endonuclease
VAKQRPFNNPFDGVKLVPPKEPPRPEPARPPPPRRQTAPALGDEELWQLATDGVSQLKDRTAPIRPEPTPRAQPAVQLDPELAAYDELRALVQGEAPFDLCDGDEFIEGAVQGLDPEIRRRLRRGDYALQGHIDLHGLDQKEARVALEPFLVSARKDGKRCVLVVHGRGLHSKDQVPVLKTALRRWLSTARFSESVLAFASARPHDGGAGALYLLLRRG